MAVGRRESEDTVAQMSRAVAPAIITTGQVTCTGDAQELVTSDTPCAFVWIGAQVDANGAAVNTKPVFIGNSAAQLMPVLTTDAKGYFFGVNNAQDVYVKGTAGEKVSYMIFG